MIGQQAEILKANELAHQIATTEMVRFVLGVIARRDDPADTAAALKAIEAELVNNINGRRHFAEANDATETYIKEAAAGFVSRVISSIQPE